MAESVEPGFSKGQHHLRSLEQGAVEGFNRLFEAQERTLKHWMAEQITRHQERLSRMFPNWIRMGAEHPQLAGGVLYMMGLLTEHTPKGSEAINSISRRFAEHKATVAHKELRPVLVAEHQKIETTGQRSNPPLPPEKKKIINRELERARLTRELYGHHTQNVNTQWGINNCQVSVLNPNSTKDNAIFISSSGGDPEGFESFAIEYALRTGKRTYILGQPDGASGHMTPEFAKTVIQNASPPTIDLARSFTAPSYEPHVQFFKKLFASMFSDIPSFELYSHSFGGIMAKKIIEDPAWKSKVSRAVFLNPAGTSTFFTRIPGLFRFMSELRESWNFIKQLPAIIRYSLWKDIGQNRRTQEFRFRDAVTRAVQDGTHYRQDGWNKLVLPNGTLRFVVGGNDHATNGKQFMRFLHQQTGGANLLYNPKGDHESVFAQPEAALDRLGIQG